MLRRRMRYSVTIGALIAISGLVLLWARVAGQTFAGDLLLNLGATVAGAVVTAIALQPLIERAQTPEVVVHLTFPQARFLDSMSDTAGRIKIMGAWPYGMEPALRRAFLEVLHRAVNARVPVQILVLDPSSDAARQRTSDMGGNQDASAAIFEVLLAFRRWSDALSANAARVFELKVFSALPPARLYLAGNRAICSFFGDADNREGSNVRHYETTTLSGLGSYVNDAFDRLWDSPETITLTEHWHVPLHVDWPPEISSSSSPEPDRRVGYAVTGGGLFLSDQQLLFDLGQAAVTRPHPGGIDVPVRLHHRIVGFSWDGQRPLRLAAFDRARDPRADAVTAAMNMKYGDEGQVRRSLLEIRPAPEPIR
ncbi:hypothetical protein [Frankia sp. AgKG'84/4]|uniref:hypothetical protein n=1 Tax=Frankia sp. AgKG'84/4 TaxID=573490 RepID=UPI0020108626|nr:hypothetical protein [Frankia sp. AgKG'84/4]MCL9793892.1 hypothetical protein [Frankia sp. AgKG'84/4]